VRDEWQREGRGVQVLVSASLRIQRAARGASKLVVCGEGAAALGWLEAAQQLPAQFVGGPCGQMSPQRVITYSYTVASAGKYVCLMTMNK
jgi:hypothetical protein